MRNPVNRLAAGASIAAIAFAIVAFLVGLAVGQIEQDQTDPYDQRNFPCQEDEVLGYDPAFGPDRVGCIHIDDMQIRLDAGW